MSHKIPIQTKTRPQAGFALIVGLMLLIGMSLVGVTMMKMTRLETLMAGGARESGIAFQAAEAALRDAEATIDGTTSIADDFPPGTGATTAPVGHIAEDVAEPDFFAAASWAAASSLAYSSGDYPEMPANGQPRYIVKHVGDVIDDATLKQSITVGGYGQQAGTPTVSIFRVTARGTSRDGSAATIVQSYYGRTY